MNPVDWHHPLIIAAIITGSLALVSGIVAGLLSRSRGKKSQSSILSKNVQQIQADGHIIGVGELKKRAVPKKP